MVGAFTSGYKYKIQTFATCVIYSIARLLYGFGYMKSPKGRVVGAILQDVAVVAFVVMGYMSAYDLTFN